MAPYRAKKVNDFPDSSPTTPPILIAGRKKERVGTLEERRGIAGAAHPYNADNPLHSML